MLHALPFFHVVSLPSVSCVIVIHPVFAVVESGGSLHACEDGGGINDSGVAIGCPSLSREKDGGGRGGDAAVEHQVEQTGCDIPVFCGCVEEGKEGC
jgi:hypothetical protein